MMAKRLLLFSALGLVLLAAVWMVILVPGTDRPLLDKSRSVVSALGSSADTTGYERALEPRRFEFPADHGAHPGYRNEWWYFTGNLTAPDGRSFGYQLTFFRIGLAPNDTESPSRWRTRQLYMAHFALSDIRSSQFLAYERFGRGAAGIAGATNPPLKVWLDHWSLVSGDKSGFPMRLSAAQGGNAIDLTLTPEKPVVLNGDRGLSRKSAEPGNASYYYSMPRLHTQGRLTINGTPFEVTGNSWLDREWSTSALAEDQEGWDWFALQLEDGTDLMIYRLRRKDGSMDPMSAGTLIDADSQATPLSRDDMDLRVLEYWTSDRTGIRYPLRWELRLPRQGLELEVEPAMLNQELDLTVRYWEGAVRVQGRQGNRVLRGTGYMELAGYEVSNPDRAGEG